MIETIRCALVCILGLTITGANKHEYHNNRPIEQPRKIVSGFQLRGSQLTSWVHHNYSFLSIIIPLISTYFVNSSHSNFITFHCRSGKFRRTPLITNVHAVSTHGDETKQITSKTTKEIALEAKQKLLSLRGTSKAELLQQEFERKRKERVIKAARRCLEDTKKCESFAAITSIV